MKHHVKSVSLAACAAAGLLGGAAATVGPSTSSKAGKLSKNFLGRGERSGSAGAKAAKQSRNFGVSGKESAKERALRKDPYKPAVATGANGLALNLENTRSYYGGDARPCSARKFYFYEGVCTNDYDYWWLQGYHYLVGCCVNNGYGPPEDGGWSGGAGCPYVDVCAAPAPPAPTPAP